MTETGHPKPERVLQRVAARLTDSCLPLERDPDARITEVVPMDRPGHLRVRWTLFGEPKEYDVVVTEEGFEPQINAIVDQIKWDIVEAVETGEIR